MQLTLNLLLQTALAIHTMSMIISYRHMNRLERHLSKHDYYLDTANLTYLTHSAVETIKSNYKIIQGQFKNI